MILKRLSHSRREYSSNFQLETGFPSRSKNARLMTNAASQVPGTLG
jgi:hypothetical protein